MACFFFWTVETNSNHNWGDDYNDKNYNTKIVKEFMSLHLLEFCLRLGYLFRECVLASLGKMVRDKKGFQQLYKSIWLAYLKLCAGPGAGVPQPFQSIVMSKIPPNHQSRIVCSWSLCHQNNFFSGGI